MIRFRLKQKMDYEGTNWIYPQISFFFGLFWFYFNYGKPYVSIVAGVNRFWGDINGKRGQWDKAESWLKRAKQSYQSKSKIVNI